MAGAKTAETGAVRKPFFSLFFTTSNHSPYAFPKGRIVLYDEPQATVHNAVKYAHYALGRFIATARESSYWEDTVFLIVADHNSRVYGAEPVPIEHFHIPALILGGGIESDEFDPVASQIDLPPTLLWLIGISATHPMIGHDLTRPEFATAPGRAIMQYNATQAYMCGADVVILRKDLKPERFRYDGTSLEHVSEPDSALVTAALAHANWSSLSYEKKLYRPESEIPTERRNLSAL